MKNKAVRKSTPLEDTDDFIDSIVENCNEKLEEVVAEVFKGNLLLFSTAVSMVVEENKCKCESPTCEELTSAVNAWANEQLYTGNKNKRHTHHDYDDGNVIDNHSLSNDHWSQVTL